MIAVLLIGVLSFPARAAAQQRPPIADEIAQVYGFGSWGQVDAVRFTFALDGGPKLRFHRSWIWEPKADQITYDGPGKDGKPFKVTYKRSELAKQDAFVKEMVDPGFFNDQYWLVFPFHLVWDTGATITDGGMKKLPLGKGSARNVVVQYPSAGGFPPGDTWSLFIGKDNRIQELAFKHGGTAKPAVVLATWEKYKKAGPILFSTFHRGKADGHPFT
ncbi:MAG TPA: hypothetical protein VGG91_10145, partial [Myxococcaceae bacterium]